MTQKLTRAGLIDFICSQDPAKLVDDFSWRSCAVGEYVRSTGVELDYINKSEIFTQFLNEEMLLSEMDNPEANRLWHLLMADTGTGAIPSIRQRTYGDLQRKLIEAKLVADPSGG